MTPQWTEHLFRLRYQISDWTLFSKKLRVLVRQLSLEETLASEARVTVPEQLPPPGFAGYLLRNVGDINWEADVVEQGPFVRYVLARGPRYYLELNGSFEEYVNAHFSGKTRATLRRKIRKFAEHCGGTIDFRVYWSPEELQVFHALAREISARTYQEKLFDGGLPDGEAFIEAMLQGGSQGRVHAFLLFDRGRPVSYLYLPTVDRSSGWRASMGYTH